MNHNNFMTMKNNYQKVLLRLTACLLLTLFAVSCTKEKEESLLKHVSRHGTIDVSGISTSGMLVNSFCGESQVKKNDFDLDMPQEAQLNTITVTNGAGSVMLLYRDKADADIVINIQSTALALVTMHPLFAPILGDDFQRLKSLILSQPSFDLLYYEVERTVKRKIPILKTENTALLIALEKVLADVLHALEQQEAGSDSKNYIFGQNCHPLDVRNEHGDELTFRVTGLWPTYNGTVRKPSGEVIDIKVLTKDGLGLMDFVAGASYGKETIVKADEIGRYTVSLSCNDAHSRWDFASRIVAEFLAVPGFCIETGGQGQIYTIWNSITNWLPNVPQAGVYLGEDTVSALMVRWWVIWKGGFCYYLSEDPTHFSSKFSGNLDKLGDAYYSLKQSFHGFPRIKNYLLSPLTIKLIFDKKANGELGYGDYIDYWVDLGLPSGLLWANRNIGALAPEDFGDYFAWGETFPKSTYNWNTYRYAHGDQYNLTKYCNDPNYGYNGYADTLTVLQPDDDAASVHWGSGARIPTDEEWMELKNNTTHRWAIQNNVQGWLFTAGNGKSLFLPAAGQYYKDYCDENRQGGHYWSSSLCNKSTYYAWVFRFYYTEMFPPGLYDESRMYGSSVRAVRSAK